jgi:hypothetical protein
MFLAPPNVQTWLNDVMFHKEWREIYEIFFKDGIEEMMRNASCFMIFVTFFQRGK